MVVKHITMFRLKEGSDEEAIKAALLDLPRQLPMILTHQLGVDLRLEAGQNHPLGKNRQISWSVTFNSISDYEAYNDSEVHKHFLREALQPVLEEGSRAAIQYNVP
jgi:hypothetical protein